MDDVFRPPPDHAHLSIVNSARSEKGIRMTKSIVKFKNLIYLMMAFIVMSLLLVIVPSAITGPDEVQVANTGDTIKIIIPGTKARLCPKPLCKQDQELARISANTEFKVEEVARERLPMWDVVWYKITYKGKKGWVSEFDTDKAPKEPRYRR
jgi:hypothetical protein